MSARKGLNAVAWFAGQSFAGRPSPAHDKWEDELCACGHPRRAHDLDGDFNGERYVQEWGGCTTMVATTLTDDLDYEWKACSCETFEEGG